MLNLKKYANGRFFDTVNKKFIKVDKLKEMIQKGEKIKVTFTKTGKDITDSIIAQFSKKEAPEAEKPDTKKPDTKKSGKKKADKKKKAPFLKTDSLKKWAGKIIDKRISEVLDVIKLPTREQVAKLDANITELNKKIDKLKAFEEKQSSKTKPVKKAAAPDPKTKVEKPKEEKTVK